VGRFSEGRAWVERLLAGLPPAAEQEPVERATARAAGLEVVGRLAVLQGQMDVGMPLLKEALETATAVGNATWRAHALHGLALGSSFWGEPAGALPLLEEALTLHREGTDPFGVPLALVQIATVHATLDDPDQAMAYAEECIALSEAASERWCAALARWVAALVQWRLGHGTRARTYARDVLRLKEPFGDRMGMAMSVEVVAWAESDAGRPKEAARLLGAVQSALDSIGASRSAICTRSTTAASPGPARPWVTGRSVRPSTRGPRCGSTRRWSWRSDTVRRPAEPRRQATTRSG
jgi:non-specific serine/threonine protein kinase